MSDALEAVLRPIVYGQIRSFVNDHPEVASAVTWYPRRTDKAETLANSIAKRILRDLLCEQTRVRLMAALVEEPTASGADADLQVFSGSAGGGVEIWTAPPPERDSDGTATAAQCEDIAVPKDCQARAESITRKERS